MKANFHAATQASPASTNSEEYLNVKRSDFPCEFVFGVATSAAQTEGATKAGGRGPSVWDQYVREFPERIIDGSNLEVATKSYKLYNEDVQAVKDLGVDAYRFSLSWSRILPHGTLSGGINQEGIDYYARLIDELVKYGIKPFVTLFHFDSPEALQHKYGGFLNETIVEDFKNYAELCFKTFGDRVQKWITINEPLVIAYFGYSYQGRSPPARCSNRTVCRAGNSTTEPYIATHNLLLAHAAAAKLYKDKYQAAQGGQIGLSLVGQYYEPYSDRLLDRDAAKRAMDFELGWFVEPLVRGKYPQSMRNLVKERLPVFTPQQKELVKGSFDFIGINYYTARYAKSKSTDPNEPDSFVKDQHVTATVERDGVPIGPNAGGSMFIYVYPQGLYKILKFMQNNYGQNLTIYITENGVTEKKNDSIPIEQALNDQFRIEFIQKHLHQLRLAMKDGVNVKGYFIWSLLDDFEWNEGFTVGYGLYYVDRKNNLKRIPKKSVHWYHDFVEADKEQAS